MVYQFRPFLNSDPPHLAEIWQSQPPQRGLMQPVSPALLELCVFSKPYFERQGLIVATDDDRPVGFAHASFGPNDDETALSTDLGVTQLVMVRDGLRDSSLARQLLVQAEQYLQERGARVLYAGGIRPLNAFYLGLYGGSELPGLLQSDPLVDVVQQAGYRESARVTILHLNLASFRPAVSFGQRAIGREFRCEELYGSPPVSWWEACTMGPFETVRYAAVRRRDETCVATARFWDVEPIASSWGLRTAGLIHLEVEASLRRRGLATWMLGEIFGSLRKQGIAMIEVQTMADNASAIALYEKLGFSAVDEGHVFRKEA